MQTRFASLLTAVVLSLPTWAQPPLSLKDAVRIALAGNKSIAAATASNDAAVAGVALARSGYLPKVNYSESWTRSDNPVFVFSSLLTQHQFESQNFQLDPLNRPDFLNNFQSAINADQPLYDAGKTRRAVHSAELARDVSRQDSRRTQMEVIASVVRSYYDAQLSADQLQSALESIRSAEADLDRAQVRLSSGMATEADVLSIRVHLASLREEQIRRSADLDIAHAALNDVLGLPLDAAHMLVTALSPLALPPASLTDYEQSGAAERPEALQLKAAKDLASTNLAETRSNLLPQISLRGAFEADRQRFYDRGGANWLVSIGLRWNLFNGLGDKARTEESQAAVRHSAAEQERADSAIRLQVRRAWFELRAAQQRIDTTKAAEAEALESLRIAQNRYEAGLSTVTDLLRVETALLETRTRSLAAVHDERIAAAMLELAAGTLTADSEALN